MGYTLQMARQNKSTLDNPPLTEMVMTKTRERRLSKAGDKFPVKFMNINAPPIAYNVYTNLEALYNNYYRKIVQVLPNGAWKGKRCFILGGGESLKGFNFNRLDGELTIGINRVFEAYYPTVLYSMDIRFYSWVVDYHLDKFSGTKVAEQYKNYRGIKAFLCPLNPFDFKDDDVYLVRRTLEECVSYDLNEGVYGGNNSGFGALMLAIALRANPIYLLGYDCKMIKHSHWHNGYPGQIDTVLANKLKSYKELLEKFAHLIKGDTDIVNLNPDSAVTCFPFDTIDNVITKKEV
jgi:hypothetical protein